jgi:excisionase family DNA binding protein
MTPLTRELDSSPHSPSPVSTWESDSVLDMRETPRSVDGNHQPDSDRDDAAGVGYTITQAAAFLGVHSNTLRKRIRTGKLPATLVDGPTGQEYRIPAAEVRALAEAHRTASTGGSQTPHRPGDADMVGIDPAQSTAEVDTRQTPAAGGVTHQSDSTGAAPTGAAIQSAARAREMAAYTEELLGPWRRRIEEQAEEIGTLRAELRQAQAAAQEALSAAEQRAAEQVSTAEAIGRLRAELEQVRQGLTEQAKVAEETGRLKAELAQATERLAEFEAVADGLGREQAAAAAEAARRPWWRFWG